MEGSLTRFARVPAPPQHPARRIGEDSVAVARDWLGLDEAAIAPLLADRIIEQAD